MYEGFRLGQDYIDMPHTCSGDSAGVFTKTTRPDLAYGYF